MKEFNVTVQKGDDTEEMKTSAIDAEQAEKHIVETFYYDGWRAVSAVEI